MWLNGYSIVSAFDSERVLASQRQPVCCRKTNNASHDRTPQGHGEPSHRLVPSVYSLAILYCLFSAMLPASWQALSVLSRC